MKLLHHMTLVVTSCIVGLSQSSVAANIIKDLKNLGKSVADIQNPYLNKFLDKHSLPKIQFDKKDFELNMDDRHAFKPKIRAAPFPSTGEPWPMPKEYKVDNNKLFELNHVTFKMHIEGKTCYILEDAIERYTEIILRHTMEDHYHFYNNFNEKTATDRANFESQMYNDISSLANLEISMEDPKCGYPHIDMDESYTLTISRGVTKLVAKEVWGALRGLETFSQIFFRRTGTDRIYVRDTKVVDSPRFPHRGILIDTSRHFMEMYVIKNVIEGMSYNKYNVLHWHIIDDNSFPYQSEVFPKLSEKGAFHPTLVYSLDDIRELVEYARFRGVRIVPEFDSPGHTFSWLGYPEIKSTCFHSNGEPFAGPMGPINPAVNTTYTFMSKLFAEIYSVFPDRFIHLGGDELHSNCWATNPQIKEFMEKHASIPAREASTGQAYINKAIGYYFHRLIDTLKNTAVRSKRDASFIMWEDVHKNTKEIPKDSILEVWYGRQSNVQLYNNAGYRALYSSCWYLDNIIHGVSWPKYYECEPSPYQTEEQEKGKLLGGEACLWAEYITTDTLMSIMWPRASAPAERLWSPRHVRDISSASRRIGEQRCRMIYRGLPVGQVSGPDYCLKYRSAPLGGHDPLKGNSSREIHLVNQHFSVSYLAHSESLLPVANLALSIFGVYLIIVAAKMWRKKARNGF